MKGVIMAGGSGTRLRPLTVSLPKPMIPFFGRPVMEYAVKLLKAHGIFEIATTLQYHPDKIINYFEGQKWGCSYPALCRGQTTWHSRFCQERKKVLG